MEYHSKSYKKTSKFNKKKKVISESETGELTKVNKGSKYPITFLPEIVTSHVIQEYRRFVNNGGSVSGFLTVADCLNQFMFASTPLLLYCWVKAVRIKKIRILCPVTTQGTSIVCSLQPIAVDTSNNCYNAVPEKYVDTSASIDIPAYLSLTPSIDTPLGSWHFNVNSGSSLVTVSCPPGSTMDILFEYIITTEGSGSTYQRVVAGATPGVLYTANILTNFVPSGRVSI